MDDSTKSPRYKIGIGKKRFWNGIRFVEQIHEMIQEDTVPELAKQMKRKTKCTPGEVAQEKEGAL